jgi:hypothetical protein
MRGKSRSLHAALREAVAAARHGLLVAFALMKRDSTVTNMPLVTILGTLVKWLQVRLACGGHRGEMLCNVSQGRRACTRAAKGAAQYSALYSLLFLCRR